MTLFRLSTMPTQSLSELPRLPRLPLCILDKARSGLPWDASLCRAIPSMQTRFELPDDCLQRLGADFSLVEELNREKDTSRVGLAHISQPVCTAVQLGLTALLSSWGVEPAAVTGHSSGEIAAAYAAGAITLDAAMTAAYYRGQATLKLKERHPDLRGAMLAVGASPEDVRKILKTQAITGVGIACETCWLHHGLW